MTRDKLNRALLKWLFGLAVMLIIFTMIRMAFHMFNSDLFTMSGNKFDLLVVYFWGFRYDLTVLFFLSLLVLFLDVLEEFIFPIEIFQKINKVLTTAFYSVLIIISVADIPYFRFNGRRATSEVFDILRDSASAFSSFLIEFAGFVIFALLLIYAAYRASRKLVTGILPLWLTTVMVLIFLALAVNFGKPLTPKNATYHVNPANVAIVTNTPLTLAYSMLKGQVTLEAKAYFATEEERRALFDIHHQYTGDSVFQKKNVVVFVLESFSREYLMDEHMNKAPAPFLESIIQKSTVFTNAFANGTTSAYGLMSILGGIPPFLDEPYFATIYGDNQLKGIGSLLREEGYSCHFFYGAEEDHYGFRKNMSLLGIDQYHSMEDYISAAGNKDYDGHWGIYDGPFFQYAAGELEKSTGPFFATIFNISTHFPYMVPAELEEELDEGYMTSHKSIAYTDLSLRQFFERIDSADWYDESLFVFVADHWAKMREIEDKSSVGIYRIPLFIYDPSKPVREDVPVVVQQLDIIPAILDMMNYNGPWMSFGSSPLGDTAYRFTFNEFENIYRIIDSSYVLAYDENRETTFSLHNYQEDPNLSNDQLWLYPEKAEALELRLKAVIQAYNNSLVRNDVYVEPRSGDSKLNR